MTMHFRMTGVIVACLASFDPSASFAGPLRIDGSMSLSRFQQQAKTKVGAPRGERLVESNQLAISTIVTYDITAYIAAGAFLEFDIGTRKAGELTGFDDQGKATIEPAIGGDFAEVWAGVLLRPQWRNLFVDIGYAALTKRWDNGRPDILGGDGNSDAFDTSATVRWIAALGATVNITPCLDLALRLEWRIRYYDSRGGQPLMDGIIHGTQEIRPLVGVAWRPHWL